MAKEISRAKYVTGAWVLFLNQDTLKTAEKLEKQRDNEWRYKKSPNEKTPNRMVELLKNS